MMPMIVFTGGGTAGHVAPNMALIHELSHKGWEIAYIGSATGIEKQMIEPLKIPFYGISSGKLRRYLSVKNLLDPFKIVLGIVQSFFLLNKLKPDVVFSKGGFVAFPVVVGAWLNRIPVVAHESDMSPGLANRLCFPFVNKICLTFEAGRKHFKKQNKIEVTGTPIREQLFAGNSDHGLELCGFNLDKPCLLVIGGSLGAGSINRNIRDSLDQLTKEYQIIHICGKGKLEPSLIDREGYKQFEYVHEQLADLFAAASIVISRAGANSLYEILALGKPHILIPLPAEVSRGDQIQNARYFQGLGISRVIEDRALNTDTLLQSLHELERDKTDINNKINALNIKSATDQIVAIIEEQVHVQSASTV
ncbi:UDP-N-acetylglucosamine-N-acetylmuramyl-(pentapeptide)pyrophosphoryl-undecaprenol N-acetylglucosamine transferase [Legionella steigerwaltii]|uniref:UDP-N-acetylglucosamine--N-acetylmuramyl-(pentapeptide) pyrophosphoryl-undecaprenol N-acetylglucosamine transferase n=1 Tax=Legionella steigerwaltii TaxID=460 RepID=A0A378L6X8_9GAMM|nr:undecaprenyldiphospho-muramoylpentapeptide beta-N-acetylglucosaminyltransferase [Legionella steigerwaltii]KTD80597.1 undecaprenyldiphospho-muramoylpentapeptide beta-N-acetylglucosaminyltransferase [Legionella steigerwaltii]STY22563.1 UDP-N-acetylglucosamine-N-acetylmuramyl-(pentapeptide)pyrophosphoryl-undecaprenol N-acetylglucosamine transferase [Legionella steigerwaltii]